MAKIKKKARRKGGASRHGAQFQPDGAFESPYAGSPFLPEDEILSPGGPAPEPDEQTVLALFGNAAEPEQGGSPKTRERKDRRARKRVPALSLAQLAEYFGNRKGRKRRLEQTLAALTASGRLIRLKGPAYTVPAGLKRLRGRLRVQRQGMGFVRPEAGEAGGLGEIYVHPSQMNGAWDGDLVLVGLLPGQSGKSPEGRVLEVLDRGRREIPARLLPQKVRENGKIKQLARPLGSGTDPRFGGYLLVDLEALRQPQQKGETGPEAPAPREGDLILAEILAPDALEGEEKAADGIVRARALSLLDASASRNGRGKGAQSLALYERLIKADHGIATSFPRLCLEEAALLPEDPDVGETLAEGAEEAARRRDLRDLDFVTIDGADARDFDDAVLVRRADRGYELWVAIADVAAYVRPGSALDAEAKARGNSCYFPASVEPMLPEALSNGLCSLKPGRPRLAMAARLLFSPGGERLESEFFPALIASKARLTYEEVQKALDAGRGEAQIAKAQAAPPPPFSAANAGADSDQDSAAKAGEAPIQAVPPALLPMLGAAAELAEILRSCRAGRGALDFDLPEPKISLDQGGLVLEPGFRERLFAHRLIEEFMIAANEAVAEHLAGLALPFLYRSHPAPETDKLRDLFKVLERNGLLPGARPARFAARRENVQGAFQVRDRKRPGPQDLQALLDFMRGPGGFQPDGEEIHPDEDQDYARAGGADSGQARAQAGRQWDENSAFAEDRQAKATEFVVNRLVLRALAQARYTPAPEGHFGLASQAYCHFTSPIRRYADLAVHRALRRALGLGGKIPGQAALFSLAEDLNRSERNAVEAEREIYKTCAAVYLSGREGEVFPAVVAGLSSFGIFAELSAFPAEGFLPLENIDDDFYQFDAESQMLRGLGRGRIFRLGQALELRLEQADPLRREIRFSLAGGAESGPERRKNRGPKSEAGSGRGRAGRNESVGPGKASDRAPGKAPRRRFRSGEVRVRKGR